MSTYALSWARQQEAGGIGPKLLLFLLADAVDDDGYCWPGVRRLADLMECDRATVFRHLRTLEDRELVLRDPRRRRDGTQASNAYVLLMPPDQTAEARPAAEEFVRRQWNDMRKRVVPLIRERDRHRCVECRATERLVTDHRIPIAAGGTNDTENLQTLCAPCNGRKKSLDWPMIQAYRAQFAVSQSATPTVA